MKASVHRANMLEIREIAESDSQIVARLHARSWQTAYRGILRDDYLDGPIVEDLFALWRGRLSDPASGHLGLLALSGGTPVGFAFAFVAHDDRWGTLLENLHVNPDSRGQGAGTRLLAALSEALLRRGVEDGIHLWVYEANHRTRRYYERLGAEVMERAVSDAPGGGRVAEWLYVWPSVTRLHEALAT